MNTSRKSRLRRVGMAAASVLLIIHSLIPNQRWSLKACDQISPQGGNLQSFSYLTTLHTSTMNRPSFMPKFTSRIDAQ
jgi:hypothetical protein